MNPKSNHLISQLNDSEYELLNRGLRLVSLEKGDQLFYPGGLIEQAYFPVTALISVAIESKEGVSIDMALVGQEGVIGLRGLHFNICPYSVSAVSSGLAYAIHLHELVHLSQSEAWLNRMYIQANQQILKQIADETACIHLHTIPQRVARWLLTRGHQSNFRLVEATHQSIADSLGVRREAVTLALQKMSGIQLYRGQVEIQDQLSLEHEACDCFRHNAELKPHLKKMVSTQTNAYKV